MKVMVFTHYIIYASLALHMLTTVLINNFSSTWKQISYSYSLCYDYLLYRGGGGGGGGGGGLKPAEPPAGYRPVRHLIAIAGLAFLFLLYKYLYILTSYLDS